MCFAILMGFFQVRQLRWRPITIFTNNHCIVFVLIVISSNHHHYHQRFVHAEAEHDLLLIISASGIFLYASYTIIAGYLR